MVDPKLPVCREVDGAFAAERADKWICRRKEKWKCRMAGRADLDLGVGYNIERGFRNGELF